jgi:hypothetical protein
MIGRVLGKCQSFVDRYLTFFDGKPRQLADIKNIYLGQTIVLLACGPSLGSDAVTKFLSTLPERKDYKVMAIKQAYDLYPAAHIHLINNGKLKEYSHTRGTLVVVSSASLLTPRIRGIKTSPVSANPHSLLETAAYTGRIEDSLLDSKTPRRWGPGIVFDAAFPLCIHLGCKKIISAGFDLTGNAGNNAGPTHFYSQ